MRTASWRFLRALPARWAIVAVALAGPGVIAPASAAAFEKKLEIYQQLLSPDGGGQLFADVAFSSDHEPLTWRACPSGGGACSVVDAGADPRTYRFTSAEPGTVFEVTATVDGVSQVARSDVWTGPVHALDTPSVADPPRVGHLIAPQPARWEGGWATDVSYLQTQVCPAATSAAGCRAIGDDLFWGRCGPHGAAVPAERYQGWYVRIVERRGPKNPIVPAIAFTQPEGIWLAEPGSPLAVASPMIGPIEPATGPPESDCSKQSVPWPPPPTGPPPPAEPVLPPRPTPSATLRRALAPIHGRLIGAQVTCPQACAVELRARHGHRQATVRRRLAAGRRTAIWFSSGEARRLRPGRLTLTLRIDGRTAARGQATLRTRPR